MAFTTVSLRVEVAKKLKAAKIDGESYSETLERLLESQPAKTAEEFLRSIAPLEGHGIFSAASRARLRLDQRAPRRSKRNRKRRVAT